MIKQKIIAEIKGLLNIYGCFHIGELDTIDTESPCVNSMGTFVALAEYFTEDYFEVYIYHTYSYSSDSIEEYNELYENLSEEVLYKILELCKEWETQSLKTEKYINN